MVATFSEGIDSVISVLSDWNRGNTDNIKPIIQDIASIGPERGKRLDLSRHDFILVFETAHNEETPELLYDFVTTRLNITVDCRTAKTREHLKKMENEIKETYSCEAKR